MKNLLKSILLFVSITLMISCMKTPMACFEMSKSSAMVNESVSFSSSCSMDMHHCEWDFGDGTKSTDTNPSHMYTAKGSYTVSFMAMSKNDKKMNQISKTITIN